MKKVEKFQAISTFSGILVLAVFALGILGVLLGSAGAYQRLVQRDRETSDSRSATQYLATKVRQAAFPGGIQVLPFGDGDALRFPETGDGSFVTWVYCYDGWLMELFCASGSGMLPQDGEKVLPAQGLEAGLVEGLLTVTVIDGAGRRQAQMLTLRNREEVLP